MRPGTSPELVTANLRLFVPEYTHNMNSRRIEFGLVLLLGNSVIFNVQFIKPNCIRGLLVDLNLMKMEF
jgi:hypothetical protein